MLAGGRGSRLGGGKPLAELGGRALIEWPLAAARDAGLEPVVVAKADSPLPPGLAERGVRLVAEPDEPVHPLAGVAAGLRAVGAPVVVCACDLPFAPAALLGWLALQDDAPVVAPLWSGHVQTMIARYGTEALDALDAAVRAGDSAARAVERAGLRTFDDAAVEGVGDPARVFLDVDSPGDLARAATLLD